MIIEREEKDGIIKGFYKSSNVLLSEYQTATKDLRITFSYGGVYTYHDVAEKDYIRFEGAESQGKILNSHIKAYPFTQGDAVDKQELKKQIEEKLEGERQAFIRRIIQLMLEVRAEYFANGEESLNDNLLKDIDEAREYLNNI
jgi:hypothetical protein